VASSNMISSSMYQTFYSSESGTTHLHDRDNTSWWNIRDPWSIWRNK